MERVTVSRRVDAPPSVVREILADVQPFMAAGGFTNVDVDDETVTIENRVGLATLRLNLAIQRNDDGVLRLEQRSGLFDEMTTRYAVTADGDDARISATTEFTVGESPIGRAIDSWVIRRQRTSELEAQFDYVEDRANQANVEPTGPNRE